MCKSRAMLQCPEAPSDISLVSSLLGVPGTTCEDSCYKDGTTSHKELGAQF